MPTVLLPALAGNNPTALLVLLLDELDTLLDDRLLVEELDSDDVLLLDSVLVLLDDKLLTLDWLDALDTDVVDSLLTDDALLVELLLRLDAVDDDDDDSDERLLRLLAVDVLDEEIDELDVPRLEIVLVLELERVLVLDDDSSAL